MEENIWSKHCYPKVLAGRQSQREGESVRKKARERGSGASAFFSDTTVFDEEEENLTKRCRHTQTYAAQSCRCLDCRHHETLLCTSLLAVVGRLACIHVTLTSLALLSLSKCSLLPSFCCIQVKKPGVLQQELEAGTTLSPHSISSLKCKPYGPPLCPDRAEAGCGPAVYFWRRMLGCVGGEGWGAKTELCLFFVNELTLIVNGESRSKLLLIWKNQWAR